MSIVCVLTEAAGEPVKTADYPSVHLIFFTSSWTSM